MGQDVCPRYNDYKGHRLLRSGPLITWIRTFIRMREEEGASMKRRHQIQIVPVWRERVDHRLYLLALLAFAEQLAREGSTSGPEDPTGGDNEGANDD